MSGLRRKPSKDQAEVGSGPAPVPARPGPLVDLTALPPQYSYPRRYWFIPSPGKQIQYLLDQGRLDDAVVYCIYALGACFVGEIPFLQSLPEHDAVVDRLRSAGRVKFFMEGSKHRYRTKELVLGPNSGIDGILQDVEFLSEPRHPWYTS